MTPPNLDTFLALFFSLIKRIWKCSKNYVKFSAFLRLALPKFQAKLY